MDEDYDMRGKTWEELCLRAFTSFNKRKKLLSKAIEELEDLDGDINTDEVEEYILTLKNGIHLPRWNLYPNTDPTQLKVHAELYYVFVAPDNFLEASWRKDKFFTYDQYREEGHEWEFEPEVKYWIPIIYPSPY